MVDVSFLSGIPLFSSLTTEQLAELATQWITVSKRKNQIIFKEGEPANHIYIVLEGSVQIIIHALMGEELTLGILNKRDIFGELTLFEGMTRTATVKALGKTELLEMPRERFIEFLEKYPKVAISLLGMISKRLRDTNLLMERQAARNVNTVMDKESTLGERISDKFADFIGSWTFIFLFLTFLFGWMALNVYALLFRPVDPYPFILLNLLLSTIAAIQGPVIMMSQGRQAKKDRITADLDYRINLKAELQIQEIRVRLDEIRSQTLQGLVELKHIQLDMHAKQLELDAQIKAIRESKPKPT